MPPDPRLVIGNIVLAKALHVMSEAECSRRYGAQKKVKMMEGTIAVVTTTRNATTGRTTRYIEAIYNLGGGTFNQKKLLLRNVHAKVDHLAATDETQAIAIATATATAPNTFQDDENSPVEAAMLQLSPETFTTPDISIMPLHETPVCAIPLVIPFEPSLSHTTCTDSYRLACT